MKNQSKQMSILEYSTLFKREWCEAKRSKNSTEKVTKQAILARIKRNADLPFVTKKEKIGNSWVLTVDLNVINN